MTEVDSAVRQLVEASDDPSSLIREALAHYGEAFEPKFDDYGGTVYYADYRTCLLAALDFLGRAVELLPAEPWLWVKLGWLNQRLAAGDLTRDDLASPLEVAQFAYVRALKCDPGNISAHFLLACLHVYDGSATLQELFPDRHLEIDASMRITLPALNRAKVRVEASSDVWPPKVIPGRMTSPEGQEFRACYEADAARMWEHVEWQQNEAWANSAGEHLRKVLEHGGSDALFIARTHIPGCEAELAYFDESDAGIVEGYLWGLGHILPVNLRAEYFDSVGVAFAKRKWLMPHDWRDFFDAALRCPNASSSTLLSARAHRALTLQLDVMLHDTGRQEACAALLDASGLISRGVDDKSYAAWMRAVGSLAQNWDLEHEWSPFLDLWQAALDTEGIGSGIDDPAFKAAFAIVLDAAARASHSLGRWWEAEEHWKHAQKFDGSAAAVWRQLSELYVEQRSYEAALEQLDGYLRLVPDDVQARHRQALLKQASRSGLTREEQRANHAELVGMIRENAEKLDQIVKFHTDALEQAAHERRMAEEKLRSCEGDPEIIYASTIDRLHDLFLQGAQLQALAVADARKHLEADLPHVFLELLPDCRDFLLTAEVFYRASHEVRDRLDAALVSVEYAKVVETEMRYGFMMGLARYLNAKRHKVLDMPGEDLKDYTGTEWVRKLCDKSTLGTICTIFAQTLTYDKNRVVRDYMDELRLPPETFSRLLGEMTAVTKTYRNGAAHTEKMLWSRLDEFHRLLFDQKLLQRLVDLRKRVDSARMTA